VLPWDVNFSGVVTFLTVYQHKGVSDMAFITDGGGNVISYAEALDVRDKDQRVFEANEIDFTNVPDIPGSLDNYIEDLTQKSTNRINQKIRASARWREYLDYTGVGIDDFNSIPPIDMDLIISRKPDFTDMCCYYTLKEYLLPKIADFGNPESPEVQKIQYYDNKFNDLFTELLDILDWYDQDNSGASDSDEKMLKFRLNRRTRGLKNVTRVR